MSNITNKKIQIKILFNYWSLLAVLVILVVFPNKAHADLSLGIYPPIIQIDATPPTSMKTQITLENGSDTALNLQILFRPFIPSKKNNGELEFLPLGSKFPGSDPNILGKMQLMDGDHEVNRILLAPQQQKQLTLHIGLPKDEPPSDYYFSILFISEGQATDQNTASNIVGGIATNVLLSIGPKDATSGFVEDFSGPFFIQGGPVSMHVLVQNESNHFIVPKGSILIKNLFGQAIGKINLLPVNILSHSQRFVPDDSLISQTDATWPEKFLLGPYSATLTIALSDTGPLFTRTIYFFAMPISIIILLIAILSITAVIVYRVRKRLRFKLK